MALNATTVLNVHKPKSPKLKGYLISLRGVLPKRSSMQSYRASHKCSSKHANQSLANHNFSAAAQITL